MKENKQYIAAVKLSVQVWIWLFNHPGMEKEDSSYWDQIKDMYMECPICEYIIKIEMKNCHSCILRKYCQRLYGLWEEDGEHKERYSAPIAATLRREYERLTGDMQFREARG